MEGGGERKNAECLLSLPPPAFSFDLGYVFPHGCIPYFTKHKTQKHQKNLAPTKLYLS